MIEVFITTEADLQKAERDYFNLLYKGVNDYEIKAAYEYWQSLLTAWEIQHTNAADL